MARSITLTLGVGLGADLGPNFNLTADVGSVTPSTATKTQLLSPGKVVSVDDLATQVTVTSTGTCTNSITQTIPCASGTTTSTTSTSTTTTTTSGASVPGVDNCGGTANLAIANSTSGTYIGYTTPTDGSNNLAVCTIGGSPLGPSSSDSFVGAFASSYYTDITNATGKTLRTWVGGSIFSTNTISSSPYTQYGDTGYGTSLVILEIID